MRILLVTDTHLSPDSDDTVSNWQSTRTFAERANADITLHLGDITRDGWSTPSELPYAASLADDWPTPIRFLPGNHDIGDNPPGPDLASGQPMSHELLETYRSHFGPDYWAFDEPGNDTGWLLVGINAQLMATNTEDEETQWNWLHTTLDRAGTRPVALFSHKPMFQNALDDEPPHIRYIPTLPRTRLRTLLQNVDCRLYASGHTHQFLDRMQGTTRHIWTPSSAYRFSDKMQEKIGEKVVGLGLLELHTSEDGHRTSFDLVAPEGMQQFERTITA